MKRPDRPGPHCIATITGRVVDLAAPTPDMIDIEDIAHALSMLCRYTGHVEYHYSVAQHSCLVHDMIGAEWKLWGLLHDAHEAYAGDISRPYKAMLSGVAGVEGCLDTAIRDAFRIRWDWPDSMHCVAATKTADFTLYCWERRDVAYVPGIWDVPADIVLPQQIITPWPAARAKAEFLERFRRYR